MTRFTMVVCVLVSGALAVASMIGLLWQVVPMPGSKPDLAAVKALETKLLGLVQQWVATDKLARDGGETKTIDAAQLLIYAARAGDKPLYEKLRDDYARRVIVSDGKDPMAQNMACWAYQPGKDLDASGTTETIKLALGLWIGSKKFDIPADRELAVNMIDAYGRHETVDKGIWLIRNFYDFKKEIDGNTYGGNFAYNTWLVDYDPDFLKEVADETGDERIAQWAKQSYGVVAAGKSPCGLLYDLLQPEVVTMYPNDLHLITFSPNDLVQMANSSLIAETVTQGRPDVARALMKFAYDHRNNLQTLYLGRTGAPAKGLPVGVETWSALVRIAIQLEDNQALYAFYAPMMKRTSDWAANPHEPRAYEAGQALLALQMIREFVK